MACHVRSGKSAVAGSPERPVSGMSAGCPDEGRLPLTENVRPEYSGETEPVASMDRTVHEYGLLPVVNRAPSGVHDAEWVVMSATWAPFLSLSTTSYACESRTGFHVSVGTSTVAPLGGLVRVTGPAS